MDKLLDIFTEITACFKVNRVLVCICVTALNYGSSNNKHTRMYRNGELI